MTVRFYFDQHMPGPVTRGLRQRGIDVLTTQDEGAEEWDDERLLEIRNPRRVIGPVIEELTLVAASFKPYELANKIRYISV